jgi:uncharacterized protein YdcH (DUF465 family)
LEYCFEKESLEDIEKGIATCKKELGEWEAKIDKYFEKHEGYNDEIMSKELGITVAELKNLLTWQARLDLGEKICKCVKEKGMCQFEAEL